jgi:hypothetical protein
MLLAPFLTVKLAAAENLRAIAPGTEALAVRHNADAFC